MLFTTEWAHPWQRTLAMYALITVSIALMVIGI